MVVGYVNTMTVVYVVHNWDVCHFFLSAAKAQRAIEYIRKRATQRDTSQSEARERVYLEIVKEGTTWGAGLRADHVLTQDLPRNF